ncbi:MAG: hypothetical protein OEQ74_12085 [Gammaproteobacteria bacterium]|nr:hypothetical protein [Gammaproteobacteria bacterium]
MKPLSHALLVAIVLLTGCARDAQNAENNEAGSQQTAFDVLIDAGATRELCFESEQGDVVLYRFEADRPLDFNLHYHIEKEIYYPVPAQVTAAEKGQYIVPVDQTYCLMWTINDPAVVSLSTEVNGAGAITWY